MKKYKVLYCGTWGYGRAGLEGLLSLEQVEVCRVFTKWDLGSGDPYLNQVYELATAEGLPLTNSDKRLLGKEAFTAAITSAEPADFLFSCCFDRIFTPPALVFPAMLAMNMHPSLLPRYRGIKPLENAIADGERQAGLTLHELVAGLDAGDILLQKAHPIEPDDTYEALYARQCALIKALLAEFFAAPENWIAQKQPQDHALKTDAPRLPFPIAGHDTARDIAQRKIDWAALHSL